MRISTNGRKNLLAGAGILAGAGLAVLLAMPTPVKAASAAKGKDTFEAKCAMCHAKNGSADTPMGKSLKISDLRSKEVQKKSDAELADIISKGKSPMPGYGSQLDKEQISDVVAFIRELGKKR
jgi:mono/diheme cytochrome c family protein